MLALLVDPGSHGLRITAADPASGAMGSQATGLTVK
jgi:hypothetical protein